jgi:hypothetical protein
MDEMGHPARWKWRAEGEPQPRPAASDVGAYAALGRKA